MTNELKITLTDREAKSLIGLCSMNVDQKIPGDLHNDSIKLIRKVGAAVKAQQRFYRRAADDAAAVRCPVTDGDVEPMSLAEFHASRKYHENLSLTTTGKDNGHECPMGGYVYAGSVMIEDASTWPECTRKLSGRWYLLLGSRDFMSDDLSDLEELLYDWARDECALLPGLTSPTGEFLRGDVELLAITFVHKYRLEVGEETCREVDEDNAEREKRKGRDDGSCATHDYCDANMTMDAAFQSAFGREPVLGSVVEEGKGTAAREVADTELWNLAWSSAKAGGFSVQKRGA